MLKYVLTVQGYWTTDPVNGKQSNTNPASPEVGILCQHPTGYHILAGRTWWWQ